MKNILKFLKINVVEFVLFGILKKVELLGYVFFVEVWVEDWRVYFIEKMVYFKGDDDFSRNLKK